MLLSASVHKTGFRNIQRQRSISSLVSETVDRKKWKHSIFCLFGCLFDYLSHLCFPLIVETVWELTPSLFFISLTYTLDTPSPCPPFHPGLLKTHSSLHTFRTNFKAEWTSDRVCFNAFISLKRKWGERMVRYLSRWKPPNKTWVPAVSQAQQALTTMANFYSISSLCLALS